MNRRFVMTRSALLIAMGALPSQFVPGTAKAQQRGTVITLIRDAETEALLSGFTTPLFRAAGVNPGMVRMTLVRDRALNAFVTTGNRMCINTGMIQQSGSVLEVIGAVAHETGHVAHGDISRLPEQAYQAMLETLGSLLIGAAAGAAARDASVGAGVVLGGQAMATNKLMAFSRGQEEQADQSALRYLDTLGWSAKGMISLFSRLEQQDAMIISRRDPYATTHPLSRDRLERVKRHVADTGPRDTSRTEPFELPYRMVKAKLDGYIDAPATVARTYPMTDSSPEARYANAVLAHRMGHRDRAVDLLEGLSREQPGNPWLLELRGQVLLESGHPQAAIVPYQAALRYAPDQTLIRQGLGHAMIETGDPNLTKQAVSHLQASLARQRDDPGTWHLLGIAWGRLGNPGEANLALAEESMLYNDLPHAKRFARMAADALPAGPSRLRALDITNAIKKENRS